MKNHYVVFARVPSLMGSELKHLAVSKEKTIQHLIQEALFEYLKKNGCKRVKKT
jgi:hypothetical protein